GRQWNRGIVHQVGLALAQTQEGTHILAKLAVELGVVFVCVVGEALRDHVIIRQARVSGLRQSRKHLPCKRRHGGGGDLRTGGGQGAGERVVDIGGENTGPFGWGWNRRRDDNSPDLAEPLVSRGE